MSLLLVWTSRQVATPQILLQAFCYSLGNEKGEILRQSSCSRSRLNEKQNVARITPLLAQALLRVITDGDNGANSHVHTNSVQLSQQSPISSKYLRDILCPNNSMSARCRQMGKKDMLQMAYTRAVMIIYVDNSRAKNKRSLYSVTVAEQFSTVHEYDAAANRHQGERDHDFRGNEIMTATQ